jgi:hypothetical protein
VGGFERRDDAFGAAEQLEAIERFRVRHRGIVDAADFLEPRMFRPDAGIIEARRNRVAFGDLAVFVLQQVGLVAVENAGRPPASEAACSLSSPWPAASTPSI